MAIPQHKNPCPGSHVAIPQHKNPWPGSHEIYNFGRCVLVHHYYILNLSEPWSREKDFKEIHNFYPKYYLPLAWGGVHEIYSWFIANLVEIGPVIREMFMDDGRLPIAIGHLSDSGP